ncbi:MAG: Lrp/AsnC family transcriptional regulator [Candidatus Hadarchaeales archaeon]
MDAVDQKIVKMLADDSRTSLKTIAKEVDLSISGARRRIQSLMRRGIIKRYSIEVDPRKYGYTVVAFVTVEAESRGIDHLIRELSKRHEVCEIHRTTGDHSLMLKVRARDVDDLNKFIEDRIRGSLSVKGVRTVLAMETVKESIVNL